MYETSYGLLIWRKNKNEVEFLIVHPSGSYNFGAPYNIPKGRPKNDEAPLDSAIRETFEETGISGKNFFYLGEIEYKSKSNKHVHCWLAEYDKGQVDEYGSCPNKDWENDEARFYPHTNALSMVKLDIKPLLWLAQKKLGL